MKKKQIVDFSTSIILILIGVVLLILPNFNIPNIKHLFFLIMIIYAIVNLIQYILTYKSKDYEGLYTSICSCSIGITGLFLNFNNPLQLSLSLMCWVTLMTILKLYKTSYYNDLRDRMWKLKTATTILFLCLGILTSINLYHSLDIQIIILGFFFFTHGILELVDPITKSLIK